MPSPMSYEDLYGDEDAKLYMTKEQARALVNSIISLIPEGSSIRLQDNKSDQAQIFMIYPKSEATIYLTCRGNELGFTLNGEVLDFEFNRKLSYSGGFEAKKILMRDCISLVACAETIINSFGKHTRLREPNY